jgi:hypothetical protein
MRKFIITKILSITIIFTTCMSCNDLDLVPLNQLSEAVFYKTETDFDGAIYASYSQTQQYWETFMGGDRLAWYRIALAPDDDAFIQHPSALPYDSHIFQGNAASETALKNIFITTYKGIHRANLVLKMLQKEDVELSDAKKSVFEAEAKFLRGFFHFQAAKLWGNAPIVTDVIGDFDKLAVPNSDPTALLDAVIADFEAAFNGLPTKAEWGDAKLGRASKWAAKAFVGKANVWKKDWAAAIAAFQAVESSGAFKLMDNFDDVFAWDMQNNDESIFEIQAASNSDNNFWVIDDNHPEHFKASQGMLRPFHFDPSWRAAGNDVQCSGSQWTNEYYAATPEIVNMYEPGDKRLAVTLYSEGDDYVGVGCNGAPMGALKYSLDWMHDGANGTNIKKYRGPRNAVAANHSPNGGVDFNNHRWYRYGGMLLLYAEALIQSGNAAGGLDIINNKIRARAGLGATTEANALKALMDERRRELAFEFHRMFDVQRWEIGSQVFDNFDSRLRYFPFSQIDIDKSGGVLGQSPSW